MKKSAAALAAAIAVLAMAALSGVALAGDHGNHGTHQHGQKSESAQNTQSSDSQPGVKPDNSTFKNQTCTTGGGDGSSATCQSSTYPGKSDASKRYGNGKTAAQIANGNGAPSGTPVFGPGNSQPHKICGRDVHAFGHGHGKQCGSSPSQSESGKQTSVCTDSDEQGSHESGDDQDECQGSQEQVQEQEQAGKQEQQAQVNATEQGKVFVCHATGSATNPFVLIHVSVNGWLHGHSRHQEGRDVLLGSTPGPCPTASQQQQSAAVKQQQQAAAAAVTNTATTPAVTTTPAAAAVTTTPAPASGVKGASKTIVAPASTPSKPSSGVLGVAKTLGNTATSGTLPFTGLRLWIVELIALGLIGGGVAMRLIARRGTT